VSMSMREKPLLSNTEAITAPSLSKAARARWIELALWGPAAALVPHAQEAHRPAHRLRQPHRIDPGFARTRVTPRPHLREAKKQQFLTSRREICDDPG
jgi:hypothetical protein